ncbi:hypothetical protein BC749_108174 [Flavobacterium araucananum]|uniref:Uncharacterized protein n=1 Tax=Flavobacterium araucananum TaxID=946678 RepID=A0A227NQB7_9FLAO|nr:hypothetical protein B0A64_20765 [Flavobacterium araucananum]PWJ97024.1 hypothetical protein BC749_108174 [Flavobacterium araucananum]
MKNKCQTLRKTVRTSRENRRYRLHQKLRRANVRFSSNLKTVFVPFDNDLQNRDIKELQNEYNYQIQLEI